MSLSIQIRFLRIVESSGYELRAMPRRTASHRLSDLLAERIAELVQEDPGLLDRALEVMDSDRYRSDYEQAWRHIVAAGVPAVVAVLTSTHPDSSALKSDSPFALLGLVDTDERRRLGAPAGTEHLRGGGSGHRRRGNAVSASRGSGRAQQSGRTRRPRR